jgi:hypothetical protein
VRATRRRRARGGLGAGGGGVRVDPVARKGMTGGSPAVSNCERGGGLLANTGWTGPCAVHAGWRRRWSKGRAGLRARACLRAGAVGGGRWAGQLGRLSCSSWSGCWAAAALLLANLDGLGCWVG